MPRLQTVSCYAAPAGLELTYAGLVFTIASSLACHSSHVACSNLSQCGVENNFGVCNA